MLKKENKILSIYGDKPWVSSYGTVPKKYHRITNLFIDYFARKNFERYKDRDASLTLQKCRRQATNGFFGEMFVFTQLYDPNDLSTMKLLPDWYSSVKHLNPNKASDREEMIKLWDARPRSHDPDHQFGNIGIEVKTKEDRDPGVALQYSSSRSRSRSNRLPVLDGAVGPNYYLCLVNHRVRNRKHEYCILGIFRGIDWYYKKQQNFSYKGVPLLGPMQNRNEHKRSLNIRTLWNTGINFYSPKRFAPRTPVERPIFKKNDFPALA